MSNYQTRIELQGRKSLSNYNVPGIRPRNIQCALNDSETFLHLFKALLNVNIMNFARQLFPITGIWIGLLFTAVAGVLSTYCSHVLVKCSQLLCQRTHLPFLDYGGVAGTAFSTSPRGLRGISVLAKIAVNLFLGIYLINSCSWHIDFMSTTMKEAVEHYAQDGDLDHVAYEFDRKWCFLVLFFVLILINLIRDLMYLAPFSLIGIALILPGLMIVLFNDFIIETKSVAILYPEVKWQELPVVFAQIFFSFVTIDVILPLENKMKNPSHSIGFRSVLNHGMMFTVLIFCMIGCISCVSVETRSLVQLNQNIVQAAKLCIAFATLATYSIQLYVLMDILRNFILRTLPKCMEIPIEYVIRIALVTLTVAIAYFAHKWIVIYYLPISILCLSILTVIFPMFLQIVTYYRENVNYCHFSWILLKNVVLIAVGFAALANACRLLVDNIKVQNSLE